MYRTRVRSLAAIGGILLMIQLTAAPAMGRTAPGEPMRPVDPIVTEPTVDTCPLQRIGTQLVRCDNLTGNGATAPAHIPEWG